MCTVLVTYEPTNQMANYLMGALSLTEGVQIDDDVTLTPEEWERVQISEQSGYANLEDIRKILRQ